MSTQVIKTAVDCKSTDDLLSEVGNFFSTAERNQKVRLRIDFPHETTTIIGFQVGWKNGESRGLPHRVHKVRIRYAMAPDSTIKVQNGHLYSKEDISGNSENPFEWDTAVTFIREITPEQKTILDRVRSIMIKYMGLLTPATSEKDLDKLTVPISNATPE